MTSCCCVSGVKGKDYRDLYMTKVCRNKYTETALVGGGMQPHVVCCERMSVQEVVCDFLFPSVLQYILNDKEVQVKTELWMKQNAEYLREQKGQHLHP